MKFRRIKAAAIVVLFLTAGVLYSANRSQDIFLYDNGLSDEISDEPAAMEPSAEEPVSEESEESDDAADSEVPSKSAQANVPETEACIRVHVCGAVKEAGVYLIPENSIVADAIKAAGGVLEGGAADYLNLAENISEGDKIYVPYLKDVEEPYGEVQSSFGSGAQPGQGGEDGQSSLVNINTADSTQLMTLSGIGQARAEAIITYRETNGNFTKIEDIMKVSGIKEGAFNKIRDRITV